MTKSQALVLMLVHLQTMSSLCVSDVKYALCMYRGIDMLTNKPSKCLVGALIPGPN